MWTSTSSILINNNKGSLFITPTPNQNFPSKHVYNTWEKPKHKTLNYNKQSHSPSNLNTKNELVLIVEPNANPDATPFARRIFNSAPNAGNNRETPVTAVSVNEERSKKTKEIHGKNKYKATKWKSASLISPDDGPPTIPVFPGNGKYCDKAHYRLNTTRVFNALRCDQAVQIVCERL